MKKIKKEPLFLLLFGLILLFGSTPLTSFAEGSVSTKGVIRLYDEATAPSTSNSVEPPTSSTTKPVGRTSLPSTGEVTTNSLWISGLVLLLLVFTFSFYRGRKGEV